MLPTLIRRLAAPGRSCARAAATSAPLRKASEPEPFSESDGEETFHSHIADIIKTKEDPALWIGQDSLVIDAVRKMADRHAAALLVFDPARIDRKDDFPHSVDACVGILTERDYLRRVVLDGRSSFSTAVREIMTPKAQVHVLTPSDTVLHAMQMMVHHDIRNIPVVDANAMVGVVTIKDVVKALLDDKKAEITSLKEFIWGNSHSGLA
ncbi:MAG: hypothetical protein J3K34DRAFT_419087 [Monoraphidium minutum]|nr:MAG: hypothetical protein J3K34DRAFT_419087 [Monoraphidium minutum]